MLYNSKDSLTLAGLLQVGLATICAVHAADSDVWTQKYGQLGDLPYSGPITFAHLPSDACLKNPSSTFDIAILGAPFDSAVSYRTGARFGPHGIRIGSRRQRPERAFSAPLGVNPYKAGISVLDCGDVPMSPYDPALAIDQLETAYAALLSRPVPSSNTTTISSLAKDGKAHPRIITLGGDHTIVLPILRSLYQVYGPIAVIHLDAHLDTWDPDGFLGSASEQSRVTHGTFFHIAHEENIMAPSIHLGIRTRLTDLTDYEHDAEVGFELITTDDIDDLGPKGIAERAKKRVGKLPVYISLDIDVVDPGTAPATGTPESGGWTAREVKKIIRGLAGLNIVGVDIVEVAPPYDTNAETTQMLAADLIHEFLGVIVKGDMAVEGKRKSSGNKDEL